MMRTLLLSLALAVPLWAQTPAPKMTGPVMRALALEAKADGAGDPDATIQALDDKVYERWGLPLTRLLFFTDTPDELSITIHFPYAMFRFGLKEAIRKREPIEAVTWSSSVTVHVSPDKINSPDIIKVVVERDEKIIPPLSNGLRPTVFKTALGGSTVLHAGDVIYPMSAFAPGGGYVSILAIPQAGENFELVLRKDMLDQVK